eukprot:jgi/Chrpa1/26190/Chrysochromulina_OHIO_Genome00025837-RA
MLLAATPLAGRLTAYIIEQGPPRGNDGSCPNTAACPYLSTTVGGTGLYRDPAGKSTVDACAICRGAACARVGCAAHPSPPLRPPPPSPPRSQFIIRGPSVTSDTYIRAGSSFSAPVINYATTNFNYESSGWWDGPLTISAAQAISGLTSDTRAVLIKFDLSSLVGATLVSSNPIWLNYFVSDAGNTASLRELVVPWNESTVTWNNLPFASASWSSTNVPSGTTGTFPGVAGWNRFDVTSSVAAWLAGSRENNGWIVLPTGGTNGVQMQFSAAVNSPYLDVPTVTPPSAPPPPPSPMRPPPPPAFSYEYNGENSSYTGGCQSTKIASDNPDYNGGQQPVVEWDGSSTTGHYDSSL